MSENKPRATIKTYPADFFVAEKLAFDLSGTGEHLWLYIEKTGQNTAWVKEELARACHLPVRDIAHSGLKDRHAVTRQWFSLPARAVPDDLPAGDGWHVLSAQRNNRKLRVGSHCANEFAITLRHVAGQRDDIERRLQQVANSGFGNIFAEQRFGHDNLARALQWVERDALPKKAEQRARTLSVLRAHCFNLQLAARAATGTLFTLQAGDRAMLAGSNSFFVVDAVTPELLARLAAGDIAPAGWLAGAGDAPSEKNLPPELAAIVAYLQRQGAGGWRALTVRPTGLTAQWSDETTLIVRFTLPRGSYATALIGEVFDFVDAGRVE